MGTAIRPTALTELQAINRCLRAISDTEINELPTDDNDVSDAAVIRADLLDSTRELCEAGYYFNYEREFAFQPDATTGEIVLPAGLASWVQSSTASRIGTAGNVGPYELVERYQSGVPKLYDKYNQSYQFTSTVYLDVYWYFAFDELPNPIRKFVAATAGLRFLVPNDGDQNTIRLMQQEKGEGQILLDKTEVLQSGTSIDHSTDAHGASFAYTWTGTGSGGRWGY